MYGFVDLTSEKTSIRDSEIGNVNKIFMNEANMVISRCNVLGI